MMTQEELLQSLEHLTLIRDKDLDGYPLICEPRFCTAFPIDEHNSYKQAALIARLNGRKMLNYQVLMSMMANAKNSDGSYFFKNFVTSINRQTGKTTTQGDVVQGRIAFETDYHVAYAAQTGNHTSKRFRKMSKSIAFSKTLSKYFEVRLSAGSEAIDCMRQNSDIVAFVPAKGGVRGDSLDAVVIDEAQEHDADTGDILRASILPTFSTRPRRQLMIMGTASTENATFFKEYYDKARNGEKGYGLLDYGALDGEDTDDETIWPLRHPGLLAGLTNMEFMREQRVSMGHMLFAREMMNVWQTATTNLLITREQWEKCQNMEATVDRSQRFCISIDVTPERTHACIAVCGRGKDNKRHIQVIESRQGVDWVKPYATSIALKYGVPIAIDDKGATGNIYDALKNEDVTTLITPRAQDVANACADFIDSVRRGELKIRPHQDLTNAIATASTRPLGNGIAWNRKDLDQNITPLVAVTNAVWGYAHLPAEEQKPITFPLGE